MDNVLLDTLLISFGSEINNYLKDPDVIEIYLMMIKNYG